MRLFLHCVLLCQCVHDLVIHHSVGVIAVVGKDGDAAVPLKYSRIAAAQAAYGKVFAELEDIAKQ